MTFFIAVLARLSRPGLLLVLLAGFALPAQAGNLLRSEKLFSHKQWEVLVAAYDDGTFSCIARVQKPGSAFALWESPGGPTQVQFWNRDWDFTPATEDIVVQIDRRAPWDLSNASLEGQSVWFDLPGDAPSRRFVNEIRRGNRVALKSSSNRHVDSCSLAGSNAAIDALIACGDGLR